jgi:hypothetical protein
MDGELINEKTTTTKIELESESTNEENYIINSPSIVTPAQTTIKCVNGFNIIEYEKSNIFVIEDIFDDDLCKEFMELIDTIPLTKITYSNGNNVKCYVNYMSELINTKEDFFYSFSTDTNEYKKMLENANANKPIHTNLMKGITHKAIKKYNKQINEKLKTVSGLMKEINTKINFDYNTGYILRKIYGPTRLHTDGLTEVYNSDINFIHDNKFGDYKMIRNSSLIIALNDDYEGGLYNFPYHGVSLRLKKGSMLIFPPFWTHPHEATELENDTIKYTITTWTCMKI